MPLPLLALGAATLPSVVKGISGLFGMSAGNRRAKNNIRPVANVNENYIKNVALAEQMGRQGLPQQQYNLAQQNIGRNQSIALNYLSRSANPAAGLQGLLRASNDASMGLDVQNANARMQNQRFAFGQRNNLAQDQQRVWNYNKAQKFNEEANAASEQIAVGRQNSFGALTDLSQLGQSYFNGQDNIGGQSANQTQVAPRYLSAGRVSNKPVALPKFTYR